MERTLGEDIHPECQVKHFKKEGVISYVRHCC